MGGSHKLPIELTELCEFEGWEKQYDSQESDALDEFGESESDAAILGFVSSECCEDVSDQTDVVDVDAVLAREE